MMARSTDECPWVAVFWQFWSWSKLLLLYYYCFTIVFLLFYYCIIFVFWLHYYCVTIVLWLYYDCHYYYYYHSNWSKTGFFGIVSYPIVWIPNDFCPEPNCHVCFEEIAIVVRLYDHTFFDSIPIFLVSWITNRHLISHCVLITSPYSLILPAWFIYMPVIYPPRLVGCWLPIYFSLDVEWFGTAQVGLHHLRGRQWGQWSIERLPVPWPSWLGM